MPTHFDLLQHLRYKIVFDPVRVEAQTGLDFLSNIDKPIQKLVEPRKAGGMWE